jgi:pimeloyl-ACP methyl ester carboxylesterase
LIGTQVQTVYQGWGAGNGKVYVGSVSMPSYSAVGNGSPQDPGPFTRTWEARFPAFDGTRNLSWLNPIPRFQGMEQVPVLAIVPDGLVLGDAPVTIFVHGITSSRAALLGVAQALSDSGRVGIAIDLPLHGLVEGAGDLLPGALAQIGAEAAPDYTNGAPGTVRERTFGLDYVGGGDLGNVPDGVTDSSGSYFLNLAYLLTGKANIMQAVADLTALRQLLPSIDLDDDGTIGDLSGSDVAFMGHSLGAMVSIPALAIQHNILGVQGLDPPAPVSLIAPGGGISKLLQGSVAFGSTVDGALALQGVLPGTPEYEFFFFASQSVVDGVDPINFASLLAGTDITNMTPLHLIEVVGGGLADTLDGPEPTPSDLVVPNNVVGAPLSGTDPLVAELGLTEVTSANSPLTGTPGGAPAQGFVKYLKGKHSSLIVPPMQITSSEDEDFWYDDFIGSLIYQEMSSTAAAFWGLTPEITVGGFAVDNGIIQ